jgi:hypothetical protein
LLALELGPEGAKAIAEVLKVNSSIQHLNLFSNYFQSFLFFPETPKLTKKTKSISKKKTKENRIGPEGSKAIAEALKINSSIRHLDLEGNDFFLRISSFSLFSFPFFPQTPKQQNQFQKQKAINLDQKEARHLQKH